MHSHAARYLPGEGHVVCVVLVWETNHVWEAWTLQESEPSTLLEPNKKVHSLHLFLSHTMQYVYQEIQVMAHTLHVLLSPTNDIVKTRRKGEEKEDEWIKKKNQNNSLRNHSVGTETHEHSLVCPSVWISDVQGTWHTHTYACTHMCRLTLMCTCTHVCAHTPQSLPLGGHWSHLSSTSLHIFVRLLGVQYL